MMKSRRVTPKSGVTLRYPLARKHSTYIVCPIARADGDLKYNSAVMLDRHGKVLAIYNKLYPVWQSECARLKIQPGEGSVVCQTDFGRVGLSICFDVNWVDQWEQMANRGAELVIWPSAYSAGRTLQARISFISVPVGNVNKFLIAVDGKSRQILDRQMLARGWASFAPHVPFDFSGVFFENEQVEMVEGQEFAKEIRESLGQFLRLAALNKGFADAKRCFVPTGGLWRDIHISAHVYSVGAKIRLHDSLSQKR
jgi:hypothetical protein